MKLLLSKSKISIVALVLMLTIAVTLVTCLPVANAAKIKTTAYLSVSPKTVGLGQTILVSAWVVPVPPLIPGSMAGEPRTNYYVVFTDPDDVTTTLGPFTSYGDGTMWTTYVPDQLGTWSAKLTWAGDSLHEGCESTPFTFTVQQEQLPPHPPAELPSGYWEPPISAENREWSQLSGPWLMGGGGSNGYNASNCRFNPYSEGPNSAHIVWTRPLGMGGIIGGDYESASVSSTMPPFIDPTIIIDGKLYYMGLQYTTSEFQPTLGSGFFCVDLRTGEELWWAPGTITLCQPKGGGGGIAAANTPSISHYLWRIGNTYERYTAFTGYKEAEWPNAMSGTVVVDGTQGICVYILNRAQNWLAKWNSSLVSPGRPWKEGIQYNVTITPRSGATGISAILSDVIICGGKTTTMHMAYDAKTGQELWVQNRTTDDITVIAGDEKYYIFYESTMQFAAYNIYTGAEVWRTEPNEAPWGCFASYWPATAYGMLYWGTYDGYVRAINTTTGNIEWKFYSGDTTETVYNTWPFFDGIAVADRKVYAGEGEHTPSEVMTRGYRFQCIDAFEGESVWSIAGDMIPQAISEGYLITLNNYDYQLYCFGKGQTATTVSASPEVSAHGSDVLIEGTVTDQSPGAEGTPAISDEDMSQWMEYLYMQKPCPADVTGVEVSLDTIDPNGNWIHIGTVTSDMSGMFKKMWTPDVPGEYTVIATFEGSESYWASYAETAIGVGPAPEEPTEPATPAEVQEDIDRAIDSLTPMFLAIVAAVVVVAILVIYDIVSVRKLRK